MLINLDRYCQELDAYVPGFLPFLERRSQGTLQDLVEDLKQSRDHPKCMGFAWSTRNPLHSILADRYDRQSGTSLPVRIQISFMASFSRRTRRDRVWRLIRVETQIEVVRPCGPHSLLRFHIDKKNPGQLGPFAHMQFSEDFLQEVIGYGLAVPRFPVCILLPTDCIDFVLSEFFPHRWPQEQTGLFRIRLLRDRQLDRVNQVGIQLRRILDKPNRTPVSLLQDSAFDDFQLA